MLRALAFYKPDLYHPANSIYDRMAPEFFESQPKKSAGYLFPDLFNLIKDCKTIKMIRFPDIENLPYSHVPLLQMGKWVGLSKILNSQDSKNSGASITKKYCSAAEFEKLNKFRIRGNTITQDERKKFLTTELHLDDYLDLVKFEAPSLEFVQELFLMVLAYNSLVFHKDLPIFLPIFSMFLDRVRAACTVQACWRGYKIRKEHFLSKFAIERRAIYCIQRW